MTTDVRTLATPQGDARLHADRSRHPIAALVLGHGAGKGEDARDLAALAASLPRHGISVFRVEQPWHVAGKKVAARPERLDEATVVCVNAIRVRSPLIMGGRSAGARVACRQGRLLGAVGCVALAFPLHPPGRPESTRLPELTGARLPTLVVQGERDAFGAPAEFPKGIHVTAIPAADHGFAVPRRAELSQDETLALLVESVRSWITDLVGQPAS